MPFIVNNKNLQKVFAEHLQNDEKALVVTMSGARGVLGITDKNRIIHCNFPFFGQSKIKEEYYISDIFSCDVTQKGQYTMLINIDVKGEKKHYSSTISPMVDSKKLANEFADIIRSKNRNARPDYLAAEEEVLDQFVSKKQHYKVSNQHLFQFNKDNQLQQKIAWSEFRMFDFYPGKLESLNLYFTTKSGEQMLLNIDDNGIISTAANNAAKLTDTIRQLLQQTGNNTQPEYQQGEQLLTTLRAGTSAMGAINPAHVLKLTDKRLVDLTVNKDGSLKLQESLDLTAIKSVKFNRIRGEVSGGSLHEIKLQMQDKSQHKYLASAFFINEINVLKEKLSA